MTTIFSLNQICWSSYTTWSSPAKGQFELLSLIKVSATICLWKFVALVNIYMYFCCSEALINCLRSIFFHYNCFVRARKVKLVSFSRYRRRSSDFRCFDLSSFSQPFIASIMVLWLVAKFGTENDFLYRLTFTGVFVVFHCKLFIDVRLWKYLCNTFVNSSRSTCTNRARNGVRGHCYFAFFCARI